MKLKRITALVLTLAIALGTVSPALAHEAVTPEVPYSVVLPVGAELTDAELAEVEGEWGHILAGAVVAAGGYALMNWERHSEPEFWVEVAIAGVVGAFSGGLGHAMGGVVASEGGVFATGAYSGTKVLLVDYALSKH